MTRPPVPGGPGPGDPPPPWMQTPPPSAWEPWDPPLPSADLPPGYPPPDYPPPGYPPPDYPPPGYPPPGYPPSGYPPVAGPLDRTGRPPDQSPRRPRRRRRWPWVVLVVLLAMIAGAGAIWTNAFGVRERMEHLVARVDLALHPPVDRDSVPTVQVTPPPDEVADDADPSVLLDPSDEIELTPEPAPTATSRPSDPPTQVSTAEPTDAGPTDAGPTDAGPTDAGPTPTPRPTPRPARKPVSLTLKAADPDTTFVSQVDNTMCAPAGLQMVLAMHGHAGTSDSFQRKLHGRLEEWETRKDAKAGGWGPAAMVEALAAYGVEGYEVRAYENRNQALRESAIAMTRTGAPAILIAWRGAHTWVMSGYKADGDPTVFGNARITGIRVFDPWYDRVSSIWGRSDPPGTLQDLSEIKRNFLQWQRPEGGYPERDGKYLVVIPTIPLRDQLGAASR